MLTIHNTCTIIYLYDKGRQKKKGKIMTEQLTAQQRATKKWNEKNKERRNYLSKRSAARSFIRNNATKKDLLELKELIEESLKKHCKNA